MNYPLPFSPSQPDSVRTILMTADTIGGVWTYALTLARSLQAYGIDVHLATMGQPLSEKQRLDANSQANVHIHESTYKLEWMDNPWAEVAEAGQWLLSLEAKLNPDIIHLNGYAHASLPWKAPVVVVAHSCVLSWWSAVKGEEAPPDWDSYRYHVKKGIQSADAVVGISQTMLRQTEKYYGPLPDSQVIYNGINLPEKPAVIHSKQPIIFGMGRIWDEAKNLALLGTVAPRLDWKVVIAGDARHPDNGQAVAIPGVELTGLLSPAQIRQYLAKAAIYCLPARYEPFGLSVLEAAISGCALILSDIETFRELWEDAAVFVPATDADALAGAIEKFIRSPALREEYARKARNRAQCYPVSRMAERYRKLYGRLVAAGSQALEFRSQEPEFSTKKLRSSSFRRSGQG